LEWLYEGCDSDLSADFLNFGASNFPFKSHLKKCFKSSFFRFGVDIPQIVLEWLHQSCESDLSADFLNFGAGNFPFKSPLKKCFKSSFFRFGVGFRFWSCNSCCDYVQESFSV